MHVLAVITARGGSATLPRKNILPFCGKPMIAYSIEAALNARRAGAAIDRVIVSTDDVEVADVSRKFGADVPGSAINASAARISSSVRKGDVGCSNKIQS